MTHWWPKRRLDNWRNHAERTRRRDENRLQMSRFRGVCCRASSCPIRPVTPELAGSSPVAPVLTHALAAVLHLGRCTEAKAVLDARRRRDAIRTSDAPAHLVDDLEEIAALYTRWPRHDAFRLPVRLARRLSRLRGRSFPLASFVAKSDDGHDCRQDEDRGRGQNSRDEAWTSSHCGRHACVSGEIRFYACACSWVGGSTHPSSLSHSSRLRSGGRSRGCDDRTSGTASDSGTHSRRRVTLPRQS